MQRYHSAFVLLALILGALPAAEAQAQDCVPSDFLLQTQADIDNFPDNCDRVTGSVGIQESVPGTITNLDGLSSLGSVGGSLLIAVNSALNNLDGLASLGSVGDSLLIDENTALTNLDGLAALANVGENLGVVDNTALTNLDGLASLGSVGGSLVIGGNTVLSSLNGLAALADVGEDLGIFGNAALVNLDGLASLSNVGGGISIGLNDALTNLDGLASLGSVGGNLGIVQNPALTNCAGLAPVLGWPTTPYDPGADSVGGTVTIDNTNGAGAQSPDDCLDAYVPPPQPATPVPVLPYWALLLLVGLLAGAAAPRLQRY